MANVLNRTTKQFLTSVNTPDFDPVDWIINPILSGTVQSLPSDYWVINGDLVTLAGAAARQIIDDNLFIARINALSFTTELFGDGDDGPTVISVDTPLTRDIYPTILTINAGVNLTTNGYSVFAQYGIINNGNILVDGANARLGVAGLGAATNTRGGGGDGALGGLGVGTAAANLLTALAPGFGGAGGTGGNGSAGAGGAGGSTHNLGPNSRIRPRRIVAILAGGEFDAINGFAQYRGGAGGGAGAGDLVNPGGSGGGGAGFFAAAAPFIFNSQTGVISARGGTGFSPAIGNVGGGGGGGGGILAAIRVAIRNRGSFLVAGGAAGAGNGTGVNGVAGSNGRMLSFSVNLN